MPGFASCGVMREAGHRIGSGAARTVTRGAAATPGQRNRCGRKRRRSIGTRRRSSCTKRRRRFQRHWRDGTAAMVAAASGERAATGRMDCIARRRGVLPVALDVCRCRCRRAARLAAALAALFSKKRDSPRLHELGCWRPRQCSLRGVAYILADGAGGTRERAGERRRRSLGVGPHGTARPIGDGSRQIRRCPTARRQVRRCWPTQAKSRLNWRRRCIASASSLSNERLSHE